MHLPYFPSLSINNCRSSTIYGYLFLWKDLGLEAKYSHCTHELMNWFDILLTAWTFGKVDECTKDKPSRPETYLSVVQIHPRVCPVYVRDMCSTFHYCVRIIFKKKKILGSRFVWQLIIKIIIVSVILEFIRAIFDTSFRSLFQYLTMYGPNTWAVILKKGKIGRLCYIFDPSFVARVAG